MGIASVSICTFNISLDGIFEYLIIFLAVELPELFKRKPSHVLKDGSIEFPIFHGQVEILDEAQSGAICLATLDPVEKIACLLVPSIPFAISVLSPVWWCEFGA